MVETRETIKETLLSRFATEAKDGNFPLVVHFDGKQLNQDFGGRGETLSREGLVLTSPYLERDVLVGVVPMETETSYAVATLLNARSSWLGTGSEQSGRRRPSRRSSSQSRSCDASLLTYSEAHSPRTSS